MKRSTERWLVVALVLVTGVYAIAEDITLTTYYPSPRGVYEQVRATQNVSVGPAVTPDAPLLATGSVLLGNNGALMFEDTAGVDRQILRLDSNNDVTLWNPRTVPPDPPNGDILFGTQAINGTGIRMTIKNTGNIGIGTTSPGVRLDVRGDSIEQVRIGNPAVGTRYLYEGIHQPAGYARLGTWNPVTSSGFNLVLQDSGGNVGIGDSTPLALLTVGSGDLFRVASTGHVRTVAGAPATPAYSFTTDQATGMYLGGINDLRFATGGIARLFISPVGRVGIGITPPSEALHVQGAVLATNGYKQPGVSGEALKMIRGTILPGGTPWEGAGFSANQSFPTPFTGRYHITFTSPFTTPPAVTVTPWTLPPQNATSHVAEITNKAADFVDILIRVYDANSKTWNVVDDTFDFIAIGPAP